MINGIEVPPRFKKLQKNGDGYPVPWFVAIVDGKPDFRVVGEGKFEEAIKHRICWLCGEAMGAYLAFVIGPMCAINRVSSEPASHKDCAKFAAMVCPFLADPERGRRAHNLPKEMIAPAGIPIARNPGVTLIWVTKKYSLFQAGNGLLIQVGEPEELFWFAHGRAATRLEVIESITSGVPQLEKLAKEEGKLAMADLAQKLKVAEGLLPKD